MADRKTPRKTFTAKQKVQIVLTILAVLFLLWWDTSSENPWWLWSPIPGNSSLGRAAGHSRRARLHRDGNLSGLRRHHPRRTFSDRCRIRVRRLEGQSDLRFCHDAGQRCDLSLLVRRFGVSFIELFIDKEKLESIKFLKDNEKVEGILFLLFLIPGTPKDLLSYFAGLTRIKLSHWIFICGVGRFPAIFLSCISGSALSTAQYELAIVAMVVIIVCSVGGILIYRHHTGKNSPTGMK